MKYLSIFWEEIQKLWVEILECFIMQEFDIASTYSLGIRQDIGEKFLPKDYFVNIDRFNFDPIAGMDKILERSVLNQIQYSTGNPIDGIYQYNFMDSSNNAQVQYMIVSGGQVFNTTLQSILISNANLIIPSGLGFTSSDQVASIIEQLWNSQEVPIVGDQISITTPLHYAFYGYNGTAWVNIDPNFVISSTDTITVALVPVDSRTITLRWVTFKIIYSGLQLGRCSFSIYQNKLFIANGKDYVISYDGATGIVTQMGAPMAANANTAGNLNGAYYYTVTFVQDGGLEEYTGVISNTVTIVNGQVVLTLPIGYAGTVTRNIYRTTAGGTILYLLARVNDNLTLTYTDNISDTALLIGPPLGNITSMWMYDDTQNAFPFADNFNRADNFFIGHGTGSKSIGNGWTLYYSGGTGALPILVGQYQNKIFMTLNQSGNYSYVTRTAESYTIANLPLQIKYTFGTDLYLGTDGEYGFRYGGTGNTFTGGIYFKYLSGNLIIGDSTGQLATQPFTLTNLNDLYNVKALITTTDISVKVWKTTDPEPTAWTITGNRTAGLTITPGGLSLISNHGSGANSGRNCQFDDLSINRFTVDSESVGDMMLSIGASLGAGKLNGALILSGNASLGVAPLATTELKTEYEILPSKDFFFADWIYNPPFPTTPELVINIGTELKLKINTLVTLTTRTTDTVSGVGMLSGWNFVWVTRQSGVITVGWMPESVTNPSNNDLAAKITITDNGDFNSGGGIISITNNDFNTWKVDQFLFSNSQGLSNFTVTQFFNGGAGTESTFAGSATIGSINNGSPKPYFLVSAGGRLIGCVSDTYPNQLWATEVGTELWDLANFVNVTRESNDNTPLTGMINDYKSLVVASQKNMYLVDINQDPIPVKLTRAAVGCLNGYTMKLLPPYKTFEGGIMFLTSLNDFRVFNSNFAQPIIASSIVENDKQSEEWSRAISPLILQETPSQAYSEFYDYKYHTAYLDTIYVFDIRNQGWTTYQYQDANVFGILTNTLYAGRQSASYVDQMYAGDLNNGQQFTASFETGAIAADEEEKFFKDLYFYYKNGGANTFTLEVIYEDDYQNRTLDTIKINTANTGFYDPQFYNSQYYTVSTQKDDYLVFHINRWTRWIKFILSSTEGRFLYRGFLLTGSSKDKKE